jgi:hypothetical protein
MVHYSEGALVHRCKLVVYPLAVTLRIWVRGSHSALYLDPSKEQLTVLSTCLLKEPGEGSPSLSGSPNFRAKERVIGAMFQLVV